MEMTKNYTITWRLEEGRDFFEQDAIGKKSIAKAVQDWRRFWGIHENDCVFFSISMKNKNVETKITAKKEAN